MRTNAAMVFHSNMIQPAGHALGRAPEVWSPHPLNLSVCETPPDVNPFSMWYRVTSPRCSRIDPSRTVTAASTYTPREINLRGVQVDQLRPVRVNLRRVDVQIYAVHSKGATVAERLDCSPPTKSNWVQSPASSLRIFASGNRAGSLRRSGGFLGDLPFPPPLHSGAAPYSFQSPSSALKTSLIRAAQISSLTHSLERMRAGLIVRRRGHRNLGNVPKVLSNIVGIKMFSPRHHSCFDYFDSSRKQETGTWKNNRVLTANSLSMLISSVADLHHYQRNCGSGRRVEDEEDHGSQYLHKSCEVNNLLDFHEKLSYKGECGIQVTHPNECHMLMKTCEPSGMYTVEGRSPYTS
ncbi:hypothetical protein PR048_001212 [Dryococelus australis]|uniref:Uncharacterized protein n=1 Tax=Dryococelus australis TaxID=614101 RepID=A0ABQ9IGT5_9NEOP|nr:hypothetical protein PR048_001212 [Dryococelus australis]